MAIVETSKPLSIESFSYSWLINLQLSLGSISDSFRAALDSSDESSFIEMDPNRPPSKRFNKLIKTDLHFDFPYSEQSTASIVHADELFSNGLLVPLEDTPASTATAGGSNSSVGCRFSNCQKRKAASTSSLRRCRSLLCRKMFEKYLYFLCPFLAKARWCRSKSRKDDGSCWTVKSSTAAANRTYCSPQASPRTSVGSSVGDWRRSCDSESSINEAVLHCKRSIGM